MHISEREGYTDRERKRERQRKIQRETEVGGKTTDRQTDRKARKGRNLEYWGKYSIVDVFDGMQLRLQKSH